ncbi:hypothetical protein DXG03_005122 [Asterophora parasitica]|uniref:Prolyl 4-hydroxylase alpha subunit Fe(2+) 2OG dioxygenase domain-containing protein n=1 Tax=Asterophora parasitica TaxID=117018 RepID=A0A9P7G625_9AGAR|nr:hypothetical protein DXG03_005122 [Asterophora parasitica]
MASPEILNSIRSAITQKPPFCTGTLPLKGGDGDFFYRQGEDSVWIDLAHASEGKLADLEKACEPATFGLNHDDVLDESYRKAGKMDAELFLARFDPTRLGIVEYVREQLLEGADEEKDIKAELYKLNVYGKKNRCRLSAQIRILTTFVGKGSFFKSHKDTPRGDSMFGSLVVGFPTPHEGGALVLRHSDKEWTFDSAVLTREPVEPSIAYIAFYSDVDHEVTLVTSGHRVTLTYNLHFETKVSKPTLPETIRPTLPNDEILHTALSNALADPSFLPRGGLLGFGLSFKYPIQQKSPAGSAKLVTSVLKGSDAVIDRVCRQLNLHTSLKAVYEVDDKRVLVSANALLQNVAHDDEYGTIQILLYDYKGRVIHEFGTDAPAMDDDVDPNKVVRLAWVTPLTEFSRFGSPYIEYYGNGAASYCLYGNICLIAKVEPFGRRRSRRQ